jgi:hypothetical protein
MAENSPAPPTSMKNSLVGNDVSGRVATARSIPALTATKLTNGCFVVGLAANAGEI